MEYPELVSSILVNLQTIWGVEKWSGPMHPISFLTKNSNHCCSIKLVECRLLHSCYIQIIRTEETCKKSYLLCKEFTFIVALWITNTVKPVHTGMPWGHIFISVWTGSGLGRVFAFGEEQTTRTCTIDMRVIIQDVSSVGLQMIGGCMQIN